MNNPLLKVRPYFTNASNKTSTGCAFAACSVFNLIAAGGTWGEQQSLDTRKEQTSTIIFSTLVGAGLGAGIGALFPKNKIIFSNSNQSISFAPIVTMNPQLKPELGVTFRINFR